MSFRELRNFTEIMRALGYPRKLSMESFRSPNFPLVADILYWLVFRYDPLASLSDNIETPDDRVAFLQAATHIVASKARIRMKSKNLYAADGRAVREMLRLASTLYEAVRSHTSAETGWGMVAEEDEHGEALASDLDAKLSGGEAVRDQARAITERGVTLFGLLEDEEALREDRAKALRFLDAASSKVGHKEEQAYVEKSVRDALREAEEQTAALQRQISELEADEKSLTARLSKTKAELERSQQRLATVKNVRPAFMDQYERLEAELAEEYAAFVRKYRNLDFLEQELTTLEEREKSKAAASNKALQLLQAQLEEEAVLFDRGDENVSDKAFAAVREGAGGRGGGEADGDEAPVPVPRPRAAAGERPGAAVPGGRMDRPAGPKRHVARGSMRAPEDADDDEDEDDVDEDGESDLGSADGESELGSEDDLGDEEDDEEFEDDF
ncbi:hypothetical protein FNF27_04862 [Cafeteria roenbergensis]|uniref:Clusterin-associated protein 1 n=1 Tax=Cafeteria roenbergensis TaxID=33653 RepID=A0A5A8E7N0_CAFRO|nr:hypothetical protein FNF27_04862 [Cafeteria roenbergensis]